MFNCMYSDFPKITVITACFNAAANIETCINSILSQNYKNIEIVIVDGLSTDNTMEIVNRYRDRIDVVISEIDTGIYDALNKGIKIATGDVISFLHSDDFFASNTVLAEVASIFSENKSVSSVFGDLQYVSSRDCNRVIRHWKSSSFKIDALFWGWMPPHPSLFVKKIWYEKISYFDTTLKISADYLSILKLFSDPSFKSIYISKVLIKMRTGGISNKNASMILLKSKEDLKAIRECNVGFVNSYFTLLAKNLRKIFQFRP